MEKSNEKKGKLKLIILYIVISALALAVRIREFNFVSGDMRYFWYIGIVFYSIMVGYLQ